MQSQKREFLLKKKEEAIVAKLNLRGMDELYVLAGDDETVSVMEEVIEQNGPEPDIWLDIFYQRMHEIISERKEQERLAKLEETRKQLRRAMEDD